MSWSWAAAGLRLVFGDRAGRRPDQVDDGRVFLVEVAAALVAVTVMLPRRE